MAKAKSVCTSFATCLYRIRSGVRGNGHPQAILGHKPLLAFILLALVGGWALHSQQSHMAHKLYMNAYQSCQRGNGIRANQTNIVNDLRTSNNLVAQFLTDAALAPYDAETAHRYMRLKTQLQQDTSKLRQYPPVNCIRTLQKP